MRFMIKLKSNKQLAKSIHSKSMQEEVKMAGHIKKAIKLISNLALTNEKNPAIVPYYPQKLNVSAKEEQYFRRERPERHGVSSYRLYRMLMELESEKRANIHNIMVIKDGALILEASAPGYGTNVRHLSHSMSKTVIGMAIGFLVDEGKLDTGMYLVDIFPEYKPFDERFSQITVDNLLTMTSAILHREESSVVEVDWTQDFFASKLNAAPGTSFLYNSMNSYMLARIVEKISSESVMDFLKPRLFEPLGIKNVFWEKSPEGTAKGGWGLYLSLESWCKLGQMMLLEGVFEGKRILSKNWVNESTSTHVATEGNYGDFNYGYQMWTGHQDGDFLFNGMLGQNVWVFPKNRVIVAINSENNELFQQSPALAIVKKYLSADNLPSPREKNGFSLLSRKEKRFFESRRAAAPLEKRRGLRYLLGFADPMPFDERFSAILGEYSFADNNSSILPTFVRVMQNNYSGGIEKLKIERDGNAIQLTSCEGGSDKKINAGLYSYIENTVDFNGEPYIIRALAEVRRRDDGRMIYKISLIYPEMPNSLLITIKMFGEEKITVKLSETPNQNLTFPLIETALAANKKLAFIAGLIEKRFGSEFLSQRLTDVFEPQLTAARCGTPRHDEILRELNRERNEKTLSMRILTSLIATFTKSVDED